MTPLDTSIRATYADGFVLDETELDDTSPYDTKFNILRAVLNKDAETDHGKLVQFSVFYKDNRYNIDWTDLPDNARPIRFRHGYMTIDGYGNQESGWSGLEFGYQFINDQGENVQEVTIL